MKIVTELELDLCPAGKVDDISLLSCESVPIFDITFDVSFCYEEELIARVNQRRLSLLVRSSRHGLAIVWSVDYRLLPVVLWEWNPIKRVPRPVNCIVL